MARERAFGSFVLAGFECSSHRRAGGQRLDLLAATGHDRHAAADYARLRRHGIRAARDGVRWHLIEAVPGEYDWSSVLPMLRAAIACEVQVVWDLCHYGTPDWLDVWAPQFAERLAGFAAAFAGLVREQSDAVPFYCPVNEISYWSWAGAEVGRFNPFAQGRGGAFKRQLVRGAIEATAAIRGVDPRARLITAEPLINIIAGADPTQAAEAERYRLVQFETADMLSGRAAPELGGSAGLLDVVGLNFYPDNQWFMGNYTIPLGHHAHRPLSDMLAEVAGRYGRPLLLAETGAEGAGRAAWLHYVGAELRIAAARGVPLEGLCLYPILDYPGWEDDRPCRVGLWSEADAAGDRGVEAALADELARQQRLFRAAGLG